MVRSKRWGAIGRQTMLWAWLLATVACTKNIDVKLPSVDPLLVVNAQLNTLSEPQTITLTVSQPYFEQTSTPPPALNAVVQLNSSRGETRIFTDKEDEGLYTWDPTMEGETLGQEGDVNTLTIVWRENTYTATSTALRTPEIKDAYLNKDGGVEFIACDFPGKGDLYLVKGLGFLDYPSGDRKIVRTKGENIVYDGAFGRGSSPGLMLDGGLLEKGVRTISKGSLENLDLTEDNTSAYVIIYSIPREMIFFYDAINNQKQRAQAGEDGAAFSSFFASPPFNVPTNIENKDPSGRKALGFFNLAHAYKKVVDKSRTSADPNIAGCTP